MTFSKYLIGKRMKKIISSILIVALLFSPLGCYSTTELTREEFINQIDNEEAILLTKELRTYYLFSDQYFVKNDTINVLKGIRTADILRGSKLIKNGSKVPFSGAISLDDISSFKLKEFDFLLTIIPIAVILGLFIVIGLSTFDFGANGLLGSAGK